MPEPLPVAIILPHAGLALPPEVLDGIALSEAEIFNEADAYADELFAFADRVLYWEMFPYARAVLDVNRLLSPAATRPGDGAVKWQTSYGASVWRSGHEPDQALQADLVGRYWQPWHRRLEAIAADPRIRLVIDAHTMAAQGPALYDDPARLRPRVMVANKGDRQGERRVGQTQVTAPPALVRWWAEELGRLLADVPARTATGPSHAVNDPFTGGADLQLHGGRHQPWLMIEVSRALYIGNQTGDGAPVAADELAIGHLRARLWSGLMLLVERVMASSPQS